MKPVQLMLALALCAVTARVSAQDTTVDEGTLVITRNGAPIGREAYRIVKAAAGGGQAYRATATISFDSLRLSLRLTTDSMGQPLTYEVDVRTRGDVIDHLDGSGRPGRFTTLAKTPHGEATHDYVVGPNTLLLDSNAFDLYYFAALPPLRTKFSSIDPRSGAQATFRFEERGQESIRIGRATTTARHFALIAPSGASRDIWVDANGRLLRVAVPVQGLVATREELPR